MCSLKGFSQVQDFQDVSYFVLGNPKVVAHFVLHTVRFVLSVFFRGAMDGSASPGDQGAKPYSPLPHPLPSPFAFQMRGDDVKMHATSDNPHYVKRHIEQYQ